jgi:hypothetical protein
MGTNLSMNPAAVLADPGHPNAQRLTHVTATLARTNQSDHGNFPGSEPVFTSEKTYAATARTRGLPTPQRWKLQLIARALTIAVSPS